jgi:hypothetical protein
MAAYGYGRPHVGYQALMANALLRSRSAVGYVTELLSGDFPSAFGRSSHHQVWSEAMVVTPTPEASSASSRRGGPARFAPQLPRRTTPVRRGGGAARRLRLRRMVAET